MGSVSTKLLRDDDDYYYNHAFKSCEIFPPWLQLMAGFILTVYHIQGFIFVYGDILSQLFGMQKFLN